MLARQGGRNLRSTHASVAKEIDGHTGGGGSGGHAGRIVTLLARAGPVVDVARDGMLMVLTGGGGEEQGAWQMLQLLQLLESSLEERCQASYAGGRCEDGHGCDYERYKQDGTEKDGA